MFDERISVAQRLSELKKEKKWSYRELEERSGINRMSLQRYATNPKISVPVDAISKLAKAFNVAPTYLLGFSEREPFTDRSNDCPLLNDIIDKLKSFTDEQMDDVYDYICYIEKRNK